MGDRVAVMKDGILQQVDSPLSLYDKPKNLFVAGFMGSPAMNLLEGKIVDGGVQIGDYVMPIAREVLAKAGADDTLVVGIRPENFVIAEAGVSIDVELVEELGADGYLYGTLAGLTTEQKLSAQQIVARVSTRTPPQRGVAVKLNVSDPSLMHVFSKTTQERLND